MSSCPICGGSGTYGSHTEVEEIEDPNDPYGESIPSPVEVPDQCPSCWYNSELITERDEAREELRLLVQEQVYRGNSVGYI
jgi:hypothetical protein